MPAAESAPSAKDAPVVQLAGSPASAVCWLVSELPAPTAPRSRNLTVPFWPSTAIQYVWPAVTAAPETVTWLFWPATGAEVVPLSVREPGLPALLEERPT